MEETAENTSEQRRRVAAVAQHGVELFFRGHYEKALGYMDQALALDPRFVRAYVGKALCLAQLGDPKKGAEMAALALALEPRSAIAYSARALCRHRSGDQQGAVLDYVNAIDLAPDDYRVYYNFACYWAERGDEAGCRRYLGHALELASTSFADIAAEDPDLARFSQKPWFKELVAEVKKKAAAK